MDLEFRFALPKLPSISTTHFGVLVQSKYYGEGDERTIEFDERIDGFQR